MISNSTIQIRTVTRKRLKQIGRKNQTYDQLINELIETRNSHDPLDRGFESLQSSESRSPQELMPA
jgi:hypothetical protein